MSLASLYPHFVVLNLIAIYPLDGVFAAKVHLLVDQRKNLETSREGHLKMKNTPFYLLHVASKHGQRCFGVNETH